jgi:hypothetical protein
LQLEVTQDEAAILVDILDSALGELREQIYKSEVAEYKTSLKQREAILSKLLAQVRSVVRQ